MLGAIEKGQPLPLFKIYKAIKEINKTFPSEAVNENFIKPHTCIP